MKQIIVLLAVLVWGCTKIDIKPASFASGASAQMRNPLVSRITYLDGTDTVSDMNFKYESGRLVSITDQYGNGAQFQYDPDQHMVTELETYPSITSFFYFNDKNQLIEHTRGLINGEIQQSKFVYYHDRLIHDSTILGVGKPNRTVEHNFYDYQGTRLTSARKFYRYYANDVVKSELQSYTIWFEWSNPFKLTYQYDQELFNHEENYSTSIKDPIYYNTMIPLELIKPNALARSNLIHLNNSLLETKRLSTIDRGVHSGMLLLDERNGIPGPDYPAFWWYKKDIVVNKYRLPESFTDGLEYFWDGVRYRNPEMKVNIQYIMPLDTF